MALEFNPSHYEIYNYLGIAYNNWRKYPKAMTAFSRVLELAPDLLSLRYKMAIVLYNLRKYDEVLEEMHRLVTIFAVLGIRKLRLTGGEPFVRKGLLDFIRSLKKIRNIEQICLTTNGVATAEHLMELAELGIAGLNLSLDTLNPVRFQQITRRAAFAFVWQTFNQALKLPIPLKINSVLYAGIDAAELTALAGLAINHPVTVRFIEQMPFNGSGILSPGAMSASQAEKILKSAFPGWNQLQSSGTATLFQTPEFKGAIGFISAYSRQFCPSCNKVRITPQGMFKTCLYDNGRLDLKAMLRSGANDAEIGAAVRATVLQRAANGFTAEAEALGYAKHSMAAIGG